MKRQDLYLSVAILLAIGSCTPSLTGTAHAQQTQNLTPAQKAAIEAAKKKKAQQGKPATQNAAPKTQPKGPPQKPVVQKKGPPPGAKPVNPPVVKKVVPPQPNAGKTVNTPPANVKRPLVRKPGTPPVANSPNTAPKNVPTNPAFKPPNQAGTNPAFRQPNQNEKNPAFRVPATTAGKPPVQGPTNIQALKTQRTQVVAKRGGAVVIKEPDQRTIVKRGGKVAIVHNESNRLQRVAPGATTTKQGRNNVTVINRPNNVQIYNITDNSGQLVKRYRRDADGRETIIIDNESRRYKSRWGRNLAIGLGVGAGIVAGAAILNAVADVPPPRVDVPRRQYIVDYEDADDDEVYEAFTAPPVDRIERRYTLDEVRATPALRDRMRRVDLNDINFESGSWEVDESQYSKLERVARALKRVIDRDPNEVFMIEGYTDAVGDEEDNLSLSDRRAESVAVILSEQFEVPAENLTTQGYGEQYLKVPTEGPERANRRVAIRRITPLISQGERQN